MTRRHGTPAVAPVTSRPTNVIAFVLGELTGVYQDFQFEGEKKVYAARERLTWCWSKEANLTVNGPVKFSVDKRERKLFVIDDKGKEHEMEIISKALRQ
jgi:hypothetical protein